MPQCPNCNKELEYLLTNIATDYDWLGDCWEKHIQSDNLEIVCPECLETLTPEELDKLNVPNALR